MASDVQRGYFKMPSEFIYQQKYNLGFLRETIIYTT